METWLLILAIVIAPDRLLYDPAFKFNSLTDCYNKADLIRQMRGDVVQTFCIKK